MKNERERLINELRIKNSLRNDWFFNNFEHEVTPKKVAWKIALVWLGLLVVNLIFWGAIIAMVVFGLSFIIN